LISFLIVATSITAVISHFVAVQVTFTVFCTYHIVLGQLFDRVKEST